MLVERTPKETRLVAADQHPIRTQVLVEARTLNKTQVGIPLGMTIATFIVNCIRGEVVSFWTGAAWILISCAVGVLLYVLIALIRAPFIVIGRHHRAIAELSDEVERMRSTPHLPIREPKSNPNIVYAKTELVAAHISKTDLIVEGAYRDFDSHGQLARYYNINAVTALFRNEPESSREVGEIRDVSAQVRYIPNEGAMLEISRGAWLSENANKVTFGLNDTHRLIIAFGTNREADGRQVWAAQRDFKGSAIGLKTEHMELRANRYEVRVRLIAEKTGEIIEDFNFDLKISREPEFRVSLTLASPSDTAP